MNKWFKPVLSFCSEQQLNALHEASLKILTETGVNIHSSHLRMMLGDAGAEVKDDLRVHIPGTLVERALATAPSRIGIHDHRGNETMVLEGTRYYFGTGSDLKFTIDSQTHQRRSSILADVARSARLCDQLENIDFVMSYGLPGDVHPGSCETEQFRAMLDNTHKPIIMTLFSGLRSAEQLHELACDSGPSQPSPPRRRV